MRLPDLELERYGQSGAGTMNGVFACRRRGAVLRMIASDGKDWEQHLKPPAWEHVSVSLEDRCPTWDEMCFVKDLFWTDEEQVVQFHPPRSQYVNHHPFCLHLWKPRGTSFEMPPALAVGPKR